ncbi:hypothetical protein PG996_003371 [Apiospora saccharicola]|uniref:Uncharacterized protein n=1 Tax=Apiospora saccharicola TaxID=335842 RepID=A0ABR1W126_9PEZI
MEREAIISAANEQNSITPAVICAIVFGILSVGTTIGTTIWAETRRRRREQAVPHLTRNELGARGRLPADAQSFVNFVRLENDPEELHEGIELPQIAHISAISLPGPRAIPVRHLEAIDGGQI